MHNESPKKYGDRVDGITNIVGMVAVY